MAKSFYIDEEECIACESCVELAPSAFVMDESNEKAVVKDIESANEEEVQEAIDTCPTQCIHWGEQ